MSAPDPNVVRPMPEAERVVLLKAGATADREHPGDMSGRIEELEA